MDLSETRALIAVPITLLAAAGIAAAGSAGGAAIRGVPVFTLCVILAFLVNWIAFIPAYIRRTEKFYDITGTITYLLTISAAVVLSPEIDARSLLLLVLVAVWSIRLGTFLFSRIHKAGEDRRFREIKRSWPRFLLAWTLQGLWVTFSLAAALAAITTELRAPLGSIAYIGLATWLFGFGFEVIADRQKSAFNADPENKGRFIDTGLWSWSRHPNYFGEIVLWIGIAVIAAPVLRGWGWLTLISPVFITLLLTRISGINMLEARADEKWGGQARYEAYKARTPVLVPRPPGNSHTPGDAHLL